MRIFAKEATAKMHHSIVYTALILAAPALFAGPASAKSALSLKSGESADVGDVYWVSHCKSLLKGDPTAEVLEGPPEVTVSIRKQNITPRGKACSKPVPGGIIVVTAPKEIKAKARGQADGPTESADRRRRASIQPGIRRQAVSVSPFRPDASWAMTRRNGETRPGHDRDHVLHRHRRRRDPRDLRAHLGSGRAERQQGLVGRPVAVRRAWIAEPVGRREAQAGGAGRQPHDPSRAC